MSHVDIPFCEEMRWATLDGRKKCTTRGDPMGQPGDTFPINGQTFRITKIEGRTLEFVKRHYFAEEGCTSPESFERLWRDLHRGAFPAHKVKWVHWYERVM